MARSALSTAAVLKKVLVLAAFVLLVAPAVPAQDVKVDSSVDRTHLRLGDNLVFTLRILSGNHAITQPILPPLNGFKSVGTYQSVENTPRGKALLFHYLLTPTEAGRLSVPDMTLRIGGVERTVSGFTVQVETGLPRPEPRKPVPQSTRPSAPSIAQDVFLRGTLSAGSAYVGQPVIYTLHLLTRRSVRGLDVTRSPDFSGFRKVEDPDATKSPTRQVHFDGRLYLDAVVIRATLFPLEPGDLGIGSFKAELRLDTAGFGGPSIATVVGGRTSLKVKPLPQPPDGFKGAVGDFVLKVIAPAPGHVDMGKPFTVGLSVDGSGFLPEAPLEWQQSPFFSPYPATTEDSSGFSRGVYKTRRLIQRAFLPKAAGVVTFPPVSLVYFDPSRAAFRTLTVGEGRVDVKSVKSTGGKEIQVAPIIRNPRRRPIPSRPLPRRLFWLLLPIPFLLNAFLSLFLWVYRSFLLAPEKKRVRELRHHARKALYRARRHLDVRKSDTFHESLSRSLFAVLDLKTGRATGGLNRSQLKAALEESGLSEGARGEALDLVDLMEKARYAPERPTRKDMQDRYGKVSKWVKGGPDA